MYSFSITEKEPKTNRSLITKLLYLQYIIRDEAAYSVTWIFKFFFTFILLDLLLSSVVELKQETRLCNVNGQLKPPYS